MYIDTFGEKVCMNFTILPGKTNNNLFTFFKPSKLGPRLFQKIKINEKTMKMLQVNSQASL